MAIEVVVEHLNHLGIVAEVCREIGVAEWLDAQNPASRQQVSVGAVTVAMVREWVVGARHDHPFPGTPRKGCGGSRGVVPAPYHRDRNDCPYGTAQGMPRLRDGMVSVAVVP